MNNNSSPKTLTKRTPKLSPQESRVLDYLRSHETITPWVAWEVFGITKLSTVISVLRRIHGYDITKIPIKYPTSPEVFFDIRKWQHLPDGTEKMMRGISLSRGAWERLREAMAQMDIDENTEGK